MKANLRKLIGTAVLGLAMFSNDIPARAGQKLLTEVTVAAYSASGTMVGARYSTDKHQYIGCLLYGTHIDESVNCAAQDKTGRSFLCYSRDPRWVTVVKAITDSSYISVEANASGSCSSLTIENHSSHLR
jgi:hypothetical protein